MFFTMTPTRTPRLVSLTAIAALLAVDYAPEANAGVKLKAPQKLLCGLFVGPRHAKITGHRIFFLQNGCSSVAVITRNRIFRLI
jgi:hypothetical protein